jgi:uncharacterized membrane protein YgcG
VRRCVSPIWLLLLALLLVGCGGGGSSTAYDPNTTVPKGDPDFPPLGHYWVIDKADVLSADTIEQGDAICQKLKEEGLAEVVVVVMNGVKKGDTWATHYGRWLKLGTKGYSTEGGNNGVVWLIRPDAKERLVISVGRGLPQFTTVDYGKIVDNTKDYLNFNNFDKGVLTLLRETDQTLRKLKGQKGTQP